MKNAIPYIGEIFSLLTALTWAIAVILFKKSGETVHPVALNMFKNVLAAILFVPTIIIFEGVYFLDISFKSYLILFISGVIGIGISDTLFFKSLNLIGAGMSAIVDCLYSPFVIFLSIVWLGESLSLYQSIGVLMIISAVLTVVGTKGKISKNQRNIVFGVFLGILAMASCAVGIVMIKPILKSVPLLWVTEVRIIGGAISISIYLLFNPRRKLILSSLLIKQGWIYTIASSITGVYIAVTFWLAGMKYTQVSIASALNQTSNIFIFIFAAIFLKESITWKKIIGITLALFGVLFVIFF